VIVDPPQVVPLERGERAVEGQDVEAVGRQVQLADDLRAEQADDVRGDREAEAREDLLGDRGPAEQLALLEDEGAQAGPREVRGADQPVVAAANDHRVVRPGHGSSAGVVNEGTAARHAGCIGFMHDSTAYLTCRERLGRVAAVESEEPA
jgi:hypothetical protein